MNETQRETALVGAFVLAALIVLSVGSLWVVGSGAFGSGQTPYVVKMQNSGAVSEGDLVRIAGVAVGRIRAVQLGQDPDWPVTFEISLRDDLTIHDDASALITREGVLGSSFLQVVPGSPAAPALAPGATILGQPSFDLTQALTRVDGLSVQFVQLMEQSSEILAQVSDNLVPLLRGAQEFLNDGNADNLSAVLAELRGTLELNGPRLTRLMGRLDSMVGQLEQGTQGLPELSGKLATLLDDLNTAIGPSGSRVSDVLTAAERGLLTAEDALSVLHDNRAEIDAAVLGLRETMTNLEAFSQQIKQRPFSLLRTKGEPDRRPGDGAEAGGQR